MPDTTESSGSRVDARCLCGDHAWRVATPLALLHHCHCTYCRKHTGAAYTTMGATPPEHFEWLARGESIDYASSPGLTRRTCARCGSAIPGDPPTDGPFFVTAAQMEGEPGVAIDGHIFTADKAPWFEIEDGLPGFPGYPPGYDVAPCPTPTSSDPPGDGTRGSCLCGAVRFALQGEPITARHCHCLRCRRARSALHASNLFVPTSGFRWTAGEDRVRDFRLPEAEFFTQSFCTQCGSAAPRVDRERNLVNVPLGALDDMPPITPQAHIFTGSKASWYDIPGALPQYAERAPT